MEEVRVGEKVRVGETRKRIFGLEKVRLGEVILVGELEVRVGSFELDKVIIRRGVWVVQAYLPKAG